MANEVDYSKEENSSEDKAKIKAEGAELQKEFILTTLKSLTRLLNDVMFLRNDVMFLRNDVMFLRNDVAILRRKMKYITFSIICMAVSSIFLSLLYWL